MDEINREQQEWDIVRGYLEQATPAQLHLFAARSNYDGNAQSLCWLIDNPNLDRATALLIYWYLGAAWYVQFESEQDMASYEQETFQQLKLLEQRYRDGYYASHNIWFDPFKSEGGRPDDYPKLLVKRGIPDLMLIPVDGTEYVDLDDDQYDDGLPMEIAEQIFALYD